MNAKYTVIYTPKDTSKYEKSDIKYVSVEFDKRKKIDEIKKKSKRKVVNSGTLDSYALRNYWKPSACEVEISDLPWSNLRDIKEYVTNKFDAKINNTNTTNSRKSVEFEFKNASDSSKAQKTIKNDFGDVLPVGTKGKLLEITIYQRADLEIDDYDELKKIFKLYDQIKN